MSHVPPGIPETAWLIDLHDGEHAVTTWANYLTGSAPPRRTGESGSWELHLQRGGTRGDSDPLEHTDRYRDLADLGRRAGDYVLKEPVGGEPIYREQTPAGSPSLLVGVRPAYDTITPGVWGLVDGFDEDNSLRALLRVTLDVTMLAEYDEFGDRDAVVDARSF